MRYHRQRQAEGATDGRSAQQPIAAEYRGAIDAYLEACEEEAPANVADLHAWLVAEHDYPGTLRSVQRYVRQAFPALRRDDALPRRRLRAARARGEGLGITLSPVWMMAQS